MYKIVVAKEHTHAQEQQQRRGPKTVGCLTRKHGNKEQQRSYEQEVFA
jgi:hypothetical protein